MDAVTMAGALTAAQTSLAKQAATIGMVAQQAEIQQQMVQMLADASKSAVMAAPGPGKATMVDMSV